MANYFYKGKEVRSRSDRDRDVKLLWAHTVTLKHTDINFRVTDSVARYKGDCFNISGTANSAQQKVNFPSFVS